MKKNIFVLSLLTFIHTFVYTGGWDCPTTSICLINDYGDAVHWNTAIKHEFIKLIIKKAPHIFVSSGILKQFARIRQYCLRYCASYNVNPADCTIKDGKLHVNGRFHHALHDILQPYLTEFFAFDPAQWQIYDTGYHLYYLKPTHVSSAGICIGRFTQVHSLTDDMPESNNCWVHHFADFFDPVEFNHRVDQTGAHPFFYIAGHGSSPTTHQERRCCGLHETECAQLLSYINAYLTCSVVGICSCHWTAQQLHGLMQRYTHNDTLSFALFTPICHETELETFTLSRPDIITYDPHALSDITYHWLADELTFFSGLNHICRQLPHKNPTERASIIHAIDAVKLAYQDDNTQRASFVPAQQYTAYCI